MNKLDIRNTIVNEEVDYLFMKYALQSYANPRAKITALLRAKELIRIKKGLYVLDGKNRRQPFVKETLANLIYGPSCLSLEYALAFYGFIPERVEILTSVTPKRDKLFHTPVGTFSYRYLGPNKYPLGITQIMYNATHPILIATPEKALADIILLKSPHLDINHINELEAFLFDDLRIPVGKINSLNPELFNKIVMHYKNHNLTFLNTYLTRLIKNG